MSASGEGATAAPDGWGVVPAYEDAFGNWVEVPGATRDRLVEAMGGDPSASGPPTWGDVLVLRAGEAPTVVDAVEVVLEDGRVVPVSDRLPGDLPLGYHALRRRDGSTSRVIVSPGRCRLPAAGSDWGWSVQVPSLWSSDSWGMGDLGDLRELGVLSASLGAGLLLVNPLDAVAPVSPREPSPYFPTTRRFLDPLYLRVDDIRGAGEVPAVAGIARQARTGNGHDPLDRDVAAAHKFAALEHLFEALPDAGDEADFRAVWEGDDRSLRRFAVFCALTEHYGRSWRSWPSELSRPESPAVEEFAVRHERRVRFFAWLQWLCGVQLERAGGEVALLGDLPIGADPDGFDAWDWQDVLADGVSVGAPPDALGPQGQNWMLPAFVPWKLRAADYAPFVELVRRAMRGMAGLRIDHVLGLFRLFWIPPGGGPSDGTYVRMPSAELLDVLALESHRNGVFVVGEDLGTVERGVRPELDARDILRYQVWWFEEQPLPDWAPKSVASVSTHDLPTIAGVWSGDDEAELDGLGLPVDEEWYTHLRRRIARATGLSSGAAVGDVAAGLYGELATAPNRIVLAQLEDALDVGARVNVPGTDTTVRPDNWSRPLPVPVEELAQQPGLRRISAAMAAARPGGVTGPEVPGDAADQDD